MSEWKNFCLGDVCNTISETYRRKSERVTLINTSDVLNGKILNHDSVLNKNLKGQFKKTFQKDDILFSEIRPINRRCAFVDFENTQDYIASTKLMVLRANKEEILPRYLYFFLTAENVLQELQHLAETRSGTFPQITFDSELATFPINLPPLETQKKIAAVLSALDDKIELNNAINKNLEEQAQAIYKNMFVDNFNPAWRKCRADEVFNISIGKTPPRKEHQWFTQDAKDITWVSISDMGSCGVYIGRSSEYLTAEAVKKFNVKKIPRNTVILSFKLTVGRVAITGRELTTNEAIAHFITNDSFMKEYLYLYLKNFSYRTMGSTSSIATAINSKIIKSMPFILPTEEELCIFHNLVEPLFLMILQNQHENKKLCELRDLLLPRLMSGEIDVSEVEI